MGVCRTSIERGAWLLCKYLQLLCEVWEQLKQQQEDAWFPNRAICLQVQRSAHQLGKKSNQVSGSCYSEIPGRGPHSSGGMATHLAS